MLGQRVGRRAQLRLSVYRDKTVFFVFFFTFVTKFLAFNNSMSANFKANFNLPNALKIKTKLFKIKN